MNLENHISKYLGAIALVFALMLPTGVEFFHLFENHEHEVCYEQTTHLHKDAPECHTCDFYSSSFQYILPENYLSTLTLLPQNKEVAITVASLFSRKLTSKQLRAPPSILS